jgi:predicted RNA-binding Zn-ribbon protein involved in translation (DUF1610 family)
MFTADPRIPIELDEKSGEYILILNGDARLVMIYCPFCGEKLGAGEKSVSPSGHLSRHLAKLSRKPGSSVRYRRDCREHWVFGRDSHMVRLFYCPICGGKLTVWKHDTRFYNESPAEVAALTKRIQNITKIDQAIERFGPPDVQRGPIVGYIYPEGKPLRFGARKVLFYEHLAKTVDVVVSEDLDGRVHVKLHRKVKPRWKKA